jgi:N5-(carboxyethyl)ornithine synthase
MKTVGFVISHKENENRRALVPEDILKVKNKHLLFIEKGYGDVLGYTDDDYISQGIGGVCSRDEILKKDIICDPKVGDAEYLEQLYKQTIFGWIHAVQNRDITDRIINAKLTAFAWEDMFEMGRHVFWRNNEIAGEAAIMHAYLLHGIFPYNTKVAVLGRGNTARGAIRMLNDMGAQVCTYDRKTERLFQKELGQFDVVVNSILWDTTRKDHIIYREDLKRMKPGAMIVDISCDRAGAVETSIPTTIENPDYIIDGIRHYVVDHTPSLFYKSTSRGISCEVVKFLDFLIEKKNNLCLDDSLIIREGLIQDQRILFFQNK